ncbi:MAG: rRNA (adenine-N6)-dimethyltransferase [Actinomycetota bacterium]|nr:rRNA (adenine-N6)-dimethyltransferase [Actinomycetota bacterium]
MPGHVSGGAPSRRRLGQHFLGSAQLAARLVADAGVQGHDRVVDFGAGTGVLTAALAGRAASVLAIELDVSLAGRLATRFAETPNVVVLHADARDVPLPRTPYRVVANPPFGRTAAILHRLLDHPEGALVRADLVVQWQVARHRARVHEGPPLDLLGAIWAPWWRFARGRRLPAGSFNPRPAVDAAVLEVVPRDEPLVPVDDFERYATFVRHGFGSRSDAPEREVGEWVARFRA